MHAFYMRILAVVVGTAMILAILLETVFKASRGVQVRRLSAVLVNVLRPSDHAWILLGGVVFPILVQSLIWILGADLNLGRIVTRGGLVVGVLLNLPLLLAARRLARRLGCMGWNKRTVPEVSCIAVALLLLIAGEWIRIESENLVLLAGVAVLVVLGLSYYLILPLAMMLSPRREALRWHTCCRVLLPAHAAALLMLAMAVPALHGLERYWTGRNTLTKIEPGIPALNRYEFEAAEIMRKELLEVIEP